MSGKRRKRLLFGTDGVRDIANTGMMTPEAALGLGRAYALFLSGNGVCSPKIAVGRDTRYSGTMIESALSAGMASAGADVFLLGVIPTPGVSYTLAHNGFDGGAMVSASHNPAEYNGIKFLDRDGFKLTDEDEIRIEELLEEERRRERPTGRGVGRITRDSTFTDKYIKSLSSKIKRMKNMNLSLVVDAANGAASALVEPIYKNWEGYVTFIADSPDGININAGVGVTHMASVCEKTKALSADLGIAYDGDTDRVLMCDRWGRVIDGDIMLWVIARWLSGKGLLGAGVAVTVMSNMALDDLLAKEGIKVFRCGVGDRYVLDMMKREGCRLGGEQSGHIIALDSANTGDGLNSGILFLCALTELGEDIGTLVNRFNAYPQVLRNIKVKDKYAVMKHEDIGAALKKAEALLGGKGRVLLRPSGTEPLIRVFVECRDVVLMEDVCRVLENAIEKIIVK